MPWPPTFETSFTIPLEWQLGAGVPAGLSPDLAVESETGISALDPGTGIVSPGAFGIQESPLDLVEELMRIEEERRKAAQAEKAEADPAALTDAKGKRAEVIKFAQKHLGKPYVWGGESDAEGGYDCSGLLWAAFKEAGIDIPRVSMSQAERGKRVSIGQLQPGDFVAWENNSRQHGADHIALYLGNGMILEAPRTGLNVRIRKLSDRELSSPNTWGVQLDY